MSALAALLSFARVYFLVVGFVLIAGGIIGLIKARSMASLLAGAISGFLLLVSSYLLTGSPVASEHGAGGLMEGLAVALLVCLALLGRFGLALFRGKWMPAGYVAPLSLIGVVVALWILLRITALTPP